MPAPIIIQKEDEFGGLFDIEIPTRWEICSRCGGDDQVDSWEGGMTREEMDEQGPEFFEDYMAGHYSTPCPECQDGKVAVADEERCTPEQLALYEEHLNDEAEYWAVVAAERRAGC